MAGRLVADSKISCKELIKARKFDLTELAKVRSQFLAVNPVKLRSRVTGQ